MTETNHYSSSSSSSSTKLWRLVVLLVAAIVAVLGISLTASEEAHAAGGKIVTKAFENPSKIQIPEWGQANLYPSEMNVSGFKRGRIRDVNLYIHGFSHTYPDDVDVMLVGPTGKNAVVMSDAGGSFSVSSAYMGIDDESTIPLPDNADMSGEILRKPANYGDAADAFPSPAPASSGNSALSVFDGSRPNGTWKLYIVDDQSSDGGQIAAGWILRITARVGR
jgi:large repetitive protein